MPTGSLAADSMERIQLYGLYNSQLKDGESNLYWRIDQHTKRVQLAPNSDGIWRCWKARSFIRIFGKTKENDCVTIQNIDYKYYLVANASCPTERNPHAGKNDLILFRKFFSQRLGFETLQHVASNKYVAKDDSDFLLLGNEEQALNFPQCDFMRL